MGVIRFSLSLLVSYVSLMQLHAEDDPFLWLEEVEGVKALEWVTAQNAHSLPRLMNDPRYPIVEGEIRKIVLAKDRMPLPGNLIDGRLQNFWQDEMHVRGLWRETTLAEFEKPDPKWETILDIDALAKSEKENWVYKGGVGLSRAADRSMISLSRGGGDAVVMREFDKGQKAFVKDGFQLPEAKSRVIWLDKDHLIVGTDFGPGSMTTSGYPRILKIWQRGTPLSNALTIFEGKETDVSASATKFETPEGEFILLERSPSFFSSEYHLFDPTTFKITHIKLPEDATINGVFKRQWIVSLRSDWKAFKAGSLISISMVGEDAKLIFAPTSSVSIESVDIARDYIFVTAMEDVKGRLKRLQYTSGGWVSKDVAVPDFGSIAVLSSDEFSNDLLMMYGGFTTPASLFFISGLEEPRIIKKSPERFDASGLQVEQRFAISKDGTRIPYFLIGRKGLSLDGKNPTLLYGYGGFEVSMTPSYLANWGKAWVSRGGVYVLANIRGGGEYGPKWHQAALREKRQNAYDDFIAVAEDLVSSRITSSQYLGAMGGSNGGLLMGVMLTQRPDLFGAIVCQVPLLDMLRYHRLLAGASWMEEYGNPDDPKDREFISRYSPYQNLRPGVKYPLAFFGTSTKDDRVHPGHARKMVAKLQSLGHDVLYFENTEGGHSGAANLEQTVRRVSLECTYLMQRLGMK